MSRPQRKYLYVMSLMTKRKPEEFSNKISRPQFKRPGHRSRSLRAKPGETDSEWSTRMTGDGYSNLEKVGYHRMPDSDVYHVGSESGCDLCARALGRSTRKNKSVRMNESSARDTVFDQAAAGPFEKQKPKRKKPKTKTVKKGSQSSHRAVTQDVTSQEPKNQTKEVPKEDLEEEETESPSEGSEIDEEEDSNDQPTKEIVPESKDDVPLPKAEDRQTPKPSPNRKRKPSPQSAETPEEG